MRVAVACRLRRFEEKNRHTRRASQAVLVFSRALQLRPACQRQTLAVSGPRQNSPLPRGVLIQKCQARAARGGHRGQRVHCMNLRARKGEHKVSIQNGERDHRVPSSLWRVAALHTRLVIISWQCCRVGFLVDESRWRGNGSGWHCELGQRILPTVLRRVGLCGAAWWARFIRSRQRSDED
jgi:hypothetical protein